jgi:hypothetical protein
MREIRKLSDANPFRNRRMTASSKIPIRHRHWAGTTPKN